MKKVLLTIAGFGFALGVFAQEAAEKKVQAGLVAAAGMNFQKMGTKNIAKNGVGGDLTIGANVNFSFNNTIGFTTGLEFDFSSMRYKANTATPTYYRFSDTEILRKEDPSGANSLFLLKERSQKAVYITVPTMMLFRTNFIGYFRYFGKFGLRNSFLASSKTNDTGSSYSSELPVGTATETTNENMKRKNEMFFYKGSIGLAGGAEWNFSGSTCLVAELGFYYGFTPLYYSPKEDKRSLFTSDGVNSTYFSNAANQSQLQLKVSILF